MKISIGSDHRGVELKKQIIEYFQKQNINYVDFGIDSVEKIDYPKIAKKVAESIQNEECQKGILICGTGIGMAIVANKFKGIRCANCYNLETAKYAKMHNNANIIAIGASQISDALAIKMIDIWLKEEFEGGRHQKRIDIILEIEKQNMK